jgi:uncharacterized DUF497 family protein
MMSGRHMKIFDWDRGNIDHVAQHGVSVEEAEEVILNSPFDLSFQERSGEDRVVQIGETKVGRILVVVSTHRDGLIRVITAFPAKARFRVLYLAQKENAYAGHSEEAELQE